MKLQRPRSSPSCVEESFSQSLSKAVVLVVILSRPEDCLRCFDGSRKGGGGMPPSKSKSQPSFFSFIKFVKLRIDGNDSASI